MNINALHFDASIIPIDSLLLNFLDLPKNLIFPVNQIVVFR